MRCLCSAFSGALLLALAASGCAKRGPDADRLREEVRARIDRDFKPDLLELRSLVRRGSSPLPGGRLVVYWDATLALRSDYDWSAWERLSPASLAGVLGAAEKGIAGISPGGNKAGDILYVYGTSAYERDGDAWKPAHLAARAEARGPPATDAAGVAAPRSDAHRLIEALAALVETAPAGFRRGPESKVVAEELARALELIRLRLDRLKRVYVFASGPEGGEYDRTAERALAVVARRGLQTRNARTAGSVENVGLLDRGEAEVAIIESEVAALAAAGKGPFAGGGPVARLRALASLFPEPVHVVVPADGPIRALADLKGKRVDIGPPGSGSQFDAVAVLGAHGVALGDLGEVRREGRAAAVERLAAGTLDALITTIAAPARELQDLAAKRRLRLVPLEEAAVRRLAAEHKGLVPLVVPGNTYEGEAETRATVAATALLCATEAAHELEVEAILDILFGPAAGGGAAGAKISRRTAGEGVTIPLHPAAERWLGR